MGHCTKIFRQEAFLGLLRHSHGYHQFVQVSAMLVRGFRPHIVPGSRANRKSTVVIRHQWQWFKSCRAREASYFATQTTNVSASSSKCAEIFQHPGVGKSMPPPKMTSNPLCSCRSPSKPSQAPLERRDVARSLSTSKLRFAVCPSCSPASLAATRRFSLRGHVASARSMVHSRSVPNQKLPAGALAGKGDGGTKVRADTLVTAHVSGACDVAVLDCWVRDNWDTEVRQTSERSRSNIDPSVAVSILELRRNALGTSREGVENTCTVIFSL
jgi:hypothetical protein